MGTVKSHGDVTADGALTASSVTTTGTNGVNGILPPYVIDVGTKTKTTATTVNISPLIVEQYLGGKRGGRIRINMSQNTTDSVKHNEFTILMEDIFEGNNLNPGRTISAYSLAGLIQTTIINPVGTNPPNTYLGTVASAATLSVTIGLSGNSYGLSVSAEPNWSGTVILYNF